MSSVPKVCWDADVLITILKGDDPDRIVEELVALREAVLAFDAGRLVVVVPTTIFGEVLEPIDDEELTARFDGVLKRSNVVVQPITAEVSLLAGRVRKAVTAPAGS